MQPFEGERLFPLPPEQLWPKLRDAGFLVRCIPDATPHDGATRDKAMATVHPGFSFMHGSLDVTIEVTGGQEPTSIIYSQKSKGIGSSSEVETALTLSARNASRIFHLGIFSVCASSSIVGLRPSLADK